MVGYDFDGVLTKKNFYPTEQGVIITGRSYQEKESVYNNLEEQGIDMPVYFSPVPISEKDYKTSSNHKIRTIKRLNVTEFYENEKHQYERIKKQCPNVKLHLIRSENYDLLQDAIKVQKEYYKGNIDAELKTDKNFAYHVYNHPEAKTFFPKDDYQVVVLLSGGIDSYVAYLYAKEKYNKVIPLYVDYGYPYAEIEKKALEELDLINEVEIVDHSYLYEYQQEGEKYWGEIFPGRNWLLSIVASNYIDNHGEIWMVAIGGEVKKVWSDKSEYFFNKSSNILSRELNKDIIVTSPFTNATKGQIVQWYINQGYDIEMLKKTVSCHFLESYNDKPCGQCMGCAHRYIGMDYNGILEEHKSSVKEYARKIYTKEINNPFNTYSKQRKKEIKEAIKK